MILGDGGVGRLEEEENGTVKNNNNGCLNGFFMPRIFLYSFDLARKL